MSNININFETIQFNRNRLSDLIDKLSVKQLNQIPNGLDHNVTWNIGHILVSQQSMVYRASGLPVNLSDETFERFKAGTIAANISEEEINYLKTKLIETNKQIKEDYQNGVLKKYTPFTNKMGIAIETVENAITFHTYHEALHTGWIRQITKLLS